MEFLNLLFVILLHLNIATTDGSKIPAECPELVRGKGHYSAIHAGKCYMFVNQEVYWNEASGDCLQMGGDLVTINDRGIMNFLKYELDNKVPWKNRGVWIGARYYDDRGWKWSTGEDVSGGYTYWAKGESKKFLSLFKFEKCTLMRREDNWQWHDYHCGALRFHYNYICQFPTVVMTMPPTTTESAPAVSEEVPVLIVRQIDLLRPTHYIVQAVAHSYQENGHSAHTSSSGQSNDNGNMSILLIVIGLAGLVIFTMLVIFFIYRKRQRDKHSLHDPRVRFENRTYGPVGQSERYRLEDEDDNRSHRPVSNVYMSPVDVNTLYEEVQKDVVNHGVNTYKDSNLNCAAPPPPPPPRSDSGSVGSSVCEGAVGGAEPTNGESPSSTCKVKVGETLQYDYIELDESTDPLIKSIYLTPTPEADVKEGNLYVDMNGVAKTSTVEVDPLEKEKKDNLLNEHVYSNALEKKAENHYEDVPARP